MFNLINNSLKNYKINTNIIKGESFVEEIYPKDILYNVCTVGEYAIHNFKYTSKKVNEILENNGYKLINTKQGYTNCSIVVLDENSLIISDKGLYKTLSKYNFDILLLEDDLDIKLLNKNGYSNKKGFIGGCISRINNKIIVFGDLSKIDKNNKIRNYILSKKLDIIEFKNLDVIDYGGIVEFE